MKSSLLGIFKWRFKILDDQSPCIELDNQKIIKRVISLIKKVNLEVNKECKTITVFSLNIEV